MKILLVLLFSIFLILPIYSKSKSDKPVFEINTGSQIFFQNVPLNANNIVSWILNTGVFNYDRRTQTAPGLEWTKGSGKFAVYATGLTISAFINGQLSQVAGSYTGEFRPGYILNGEAITNDDFKIYSVKYSDNNTNPDYANWYKMVPYGAPFEDVNNNGIFEPGIDKPGMKDAAQTIFVALTSGFPESRISSEGFGGGITDPLMLADVRFTAWCFNQPGLEDAQFFRWQIINQSQQHVWERTRIGLVFDPDIGVPDNDYIGCDTNLKLGYAYNATPNDGTGAGNSYGSAPPAYGMLMLAGPGNSSMPDTPMFSSFSFFTDESASPPPCEGDAFGSPMKAHMFLSGFKNDSTQWIDRTTLLPTKYTYAGDPETLSGWTEFTGSIQNCNGNLTGPTTSPNPPGDRRMIIGNGSENFQVTPGTMLTMISSQFVKRGNSNTNSVSRLKQEATFIRWLYQEGHIINISQISNQIPESFSLQQNYPNPFNPTTTIEFEIPARDFIKLELFDVTGRLVSELISSELQPGVYAYELNASMLNSGVYFYKLTGNNFTATKKLVLIK